MSTYLSPSPFLQFFDASGNLLSGGQLFTYLNNTDTPATTYTDGTGATPNKNPIILDAYGSANVWLPAGQLFTFVLSPSTDTNPPTNPIRTVNNIASGGAIATVNFASDTGVANVCVASIPGVMSLFSGLAITIDIANTNTGPTTLNINGFGANPVVLQNGGALGGSELQESGQYLLQYTGTEWQILGFSITADKEITATEATFGITPSSYAYGEGDLRRYGAVASASAPAPSVQGANAAALNTAFLISAAGGSAVYIPPGRWYYDATVYTGSNTYGASSAYGAGSQSVLVPTSNVDGLTFVSDPNFNPPTSGRFFRDFVIQGPSASSSQNNGIYFPLGMGRVGGILFSNIGISNFAYGVNLQSTPNGLWASQFINCYLYNNYYGYRFYGQSISNRISGGFVQAGSMAAPTGAPTAYGIGISCDSNSGANTQGLTLDGSFQVYGHAVDSYFNLTVDIAISNCAFSVFSQIGISIGDVQGGFFVNGCWVQATANSANCTAINIVSIGTAIADKIVITGNNLYGNSDAGTTGIFVGSSNNGVTIRDNTIGNGFFPFVTGITGASGVNAQNLVAQGNTIYATTTAIELYVGATNAAIGPNSILSGTPLVFSSGTPSGLVYTHAPTPMAGTVTFSTATSAAVAFAVPMPSATYEVFPGGNAAGYCWPTSQTANGFQMNCSASNSNTMTWSVRYG